jgi:universal stress protein F
LQRLAASNARATREAPVIGYGDAWRAIVAAADQLDVDLVVMGSHLYHFPDQVLGTVAGKLANRGTRNVLVVR